MFSITVKRILQEDNMGHIYVSGVIEKHVRTADEALEEFKKGQVNQNHPPGTFKTESSCCSQTVFLFEIVHTGLNPKTSETSQGKDKFNQLCIVYLNNSKDVPQNLTLCQRFQNSGYANKAVSVLHKCFEAYQESLNSVMRKVIPYQDLKLTQLFQSYFKGEGKIRVLTVVNHVENYTSTAKAMKFAEKRQDISSPPFSSIALSAESKLHGQISMSGKKYSNECECITPLTREQIPSINTSYSSKNLMEDELMCNNLENSLNIKLLRHKNLVQNLRNMQESFRKKLTIIENENVGFKQENIVLLQDLKDRECLSQTLQQRIILAEKIENLKRQNFEIQQQAEKAKIELDHKIKRLIEQSHEIEEAKQKMYEKFAQEKGKLKKIMDKRFAAKQAELKRRLCFIDEKLKQLREILNIGDWDTFGNKNMFSAPSIRSFRGSFCSIKLNITQSNKTNSISENSVTCSNSMKYQSKNGHHERKNQMDFNINDCFSSERITASNSSDIGGISGKKQNKGKKLWIEHKPLENLQINGALEPKIKKKITVWRLNFKDLKKHKASKYILHYQEIDSHGEIETQFYKGDIMQSLGGGKQVFFTDIEKICLVSTVNDYLLKRNGESVPLNEIKEIGGIINSGKKQNKGKKLGIELKPLENLQIRKDEIEGRRFEIIFVINSYST